MIETRGIEADAELGFSSLLTLGASDRARARRARRPVRRRPARRPDARDAPPHRRRARAPRARTASSPASPNVARCWSSSTTPSTSTRRRATVLAFVISRLAQDSVAAVLTTDGELPAPLADLMLPVERLRRISARRSSRRWSPPTGAVAPDTLQQCCSLANGNPLIALELARSLSDDERTGRVPRCRCVPKLPRDPGPPVRHALRRVRSGGDACVGRRRGR